MKNVLTFLEDLQKNNDREWFHSHKSRYLEAKSEFEGFITILLPRLAEIDKELSGLEPKQCIFRIFRDVRFSKDKSPYKTNMGAAMTRGGRKSPYATYYFHIEPDNSFAGGGIWMPAAPVLKAMRQEVYYNAEEFKGIIGSASFRKYFSGLDGAKLKRPPRDFNVDFPDIELLKYKSYITGSMIDDDSLTSGELLEKLLDVYRALYPFNSFINRALSEI
ncbi:MAG: DUF2461 domain-containing protein [Bacteroidota bacterium]